MKCLYNHLTKDIGGEIMAKVKGTNRRTRPKSGYKKQGNKKGRGVKEKRYRG